MLLLNTYEVGKHVVILRHILQKTFLCNKPLSNLMLLLFNSAYLKRIRNGTQAK